MEVVAWSLILMGLCAVPTGKWIAYNGEPPGEPGHDQLAAGMRAVGPFIARAGLVAVLLGLVVLLATIVG